MVGKPAMASVISLLWVVVMSLMFMNRLVAEVLWQGMSVRWCTTENNCRRKRQNRNDDNQKVQHKMTRNKLSIEMPLRLRLMSYFK